jgi:hypothetical protein
MEIVMEHKSDETVLAFIDEVLSETHPDVKLDLLKNILAYPRYQKMTVMEILEAELKAKEGFEKQLAAMKEKKQ